MHLKCLRCRFLHPELITIASVSPTFDVDSVLKTKKNKKNHTMKKDGATYQQVDRSS
jgi:hypothetical protein